MHYMSSSKSCNTATLTVLMPSDSIDISNRCYEKRNPELPSFGGVQTKAHRGGKEGAPIADELSGNDIDEALGTAIGDQKEVRTVTREVG